LFSFTTNSFINHHTSVRSAALWAISSNRSRFNRTATSKEQPCNFRKLQENETLVTKKDVTVFEVAAYIISKLGTISAMKLQKLVYYCQAWALVWDEKPLFLEKGSSRTCVGKIISF
jgi:hypothetical protein